MSDGDERGDFDRAGAPRDALRAPVTRVFEAGLAVGLEVASGSGGAGLDAQQP